MDELLLENSLCTSQAEYDAIVKDKEKVADIFFINYFGFLSLFTIGLRGELKRYKSEESSLYPKYIDFSNKDVSLSVKMLFDARIGRGAVTARMTKLLAKIKGNMLEPKDIDNDMMKELLVDSKITTVNKPSVKIRTIMNKWLDDECTIEWVAFYLYKIARLPEYKDITKEFVSAYKTGQYAQAYNNILIGARKKHTGNIPKDLQDNDPTNIANSTTPSQSQQLPTDDTDTVVPQTKQVANTVSKDDFMALFKKAIDDAKAKTATPVVTVAPVVDPIDDTPADVTQTTIPTAVLDNDTKPADVVNPIDADTTSTADAEAVDKLDILDNVVNQQIDDQGDTHTKVELDTVDHANDVPVENNTDYDKTPDQHHDPATTVEDEELNLTMFQALDKFLVLSNGARLEFVPPTQKIILTDGTPDVVGTSDWYGGARKTILRGVFQKAVDGGVSTTKANFISFMNSIEKALTEFEFHTGLHTLSNWFDSDDIQSALMVLFTHAQTKTKSGDYLFNDKSYRWKFIKNMNNKQYPWLVETAHAVLYEQESTLAEAGEYLYAMVNRIAKGEIPADTAMASLTISFLIQSVMNSQKMWFNGDTTGGGDNATQIVYGLEINNQDANAMLVSAILDGLLTKKFDTKFLKDTGLNSILYQKHMFVGVKDTVLIQLGHNNAVLLDQVFAEIFKKYSSQADYILGLGEIDVDSDLKVYTNPNNVPIFRDVSDVWANGFEAQRLIKTSNLMFTLMYNGWVTKDTPDGLSRENFAPEQVDKFIKYVDSIDYVSVSDKPSTEGDDFHWKITQGLRNNGVSKRLIDADTKDKIASVFLFNSFYDDLNGGFDIIINATPDIKELRIKLIALIEIYNSIDLMSDFPFYKTVHDEAQRRLKEITSVDDVAELEKTTHVYDIGDNYESITQLAEYSAIGDVIVEYLDSDIDKAKSFFGKDSKFICTNDSYRGKTSRTKYKTVPDTIYDYCVKMVKDGSIAVEELHEQMIFQMFKKGDLVADDINHLINVLLLSDEWDSFVNGAEKITRLPFLDIITVAVQSDSDINTKYVNEILDVISAKAKDKSNNQVNSIPFMGVMCATNNIDKVVSSDLYDKMILISHDALAQFRFKNTGIVTSIQYLMTVGQIKNADVLQQCDEIFKNHYNFSSIKLETRNQAEFELIYDVENFKKRDVEVQKLMINTLLREFNRKKLSWWMQADGREIYLEKILELMEASAYKYGEAELDSIISLTRMKTMLINSTAHQIDYDKMQDDLNSGLINTPKKIKRDMLMKLAKLNGVGQLSKDELKFPRGARTIDVLKHMRGEIKLVDKIEVQLKDVPYEEVEHTEESLKRVNAKMWKTRNRHHQDHMPIFEKEFKPLKDTNNVDTFLKDNPDSKVLELAFHGTGRIAGAYIVRYGFADVRGDVGIGIAGKALGNGIYVAVHYNKSGIYATDNGVAYHAGKHDGYLFKLRVALGKKGVHHQYGGPEAPMFWAAPEWCVKFPTQQIDVKSVFLMHSVKRSEAHNLLGDYK